MTLLQSTGKESRHLNFKRKQNQVISKKSSCQPGILFSQFYTTIVKSVGPSSLFS